MIEPKLPIQRAAIIGDGAMGTVCALILAEKGIDTCLWGAFPGQIAETDRHRENRRFLPGYRLPANIRCTADAGAALSDAQFVVNAVPCQFIRSVWQRIGPLCPAGAPIVSVAKGIEVDTLLRPTQVIASFVNHAVMAVLSGPTIAPEVAAGLPAAIVAASADEKAVRLTQAAFNTPSLRVYTNNDILGVELSGAVKNVIAISAGIVDGIGAGCNAKAALLTRGIVEITRLGVAMGADAETFRGLAGVGDLVTTCISTVGRNRSAGEKIGRGMTVADLLASSTSVIEGIETARSVVMLARKHEVQMPITEAVHAVLFENLAPADAIERLMSRELKPE